MITGPVGGEFGYVNVAVVLERVSLDSIGISGVMRLHRERGGEGGSVLM